MNQNNLKGSYVLKSLSYIVLPILIVLMIANVFAIWYTIENKDIQTAQSYFDTDNFVNIYKDKLNIITNMASTYNYRNSSSYYTNEESLIPIQPNEKMQIQYGMYSQTNLNYLIVDRVNNQAYTNLEHTMRTDTVDQIKEILANERYYWNYQNGNIETSIDKMSLENLKYSHIYSDLEENQLEVYSYVGEDLINADAFTVGQISYTVVKNMNQSIYILLPVYIVLAIIIIIYLAISTGYKKGKDGIHLNWFDQLSLEPAGILVIGIALIGGIFFTFVESGSYIIGGIGIFIMIICEYIAGIVGLATIVKRIKSKTLLKNTLTYKCIHWIIVKIQSIYNRIVNNLKLTTRLVLLFGSFALISFLLLLVAMEGNGFFALTLLVFWFITFLFVLDKINEFMRIKEAVKNIYEGKNDVHLNPQEYKGELKELSTYVNDIAGGFSNAIEESLKSERMKTELITNVSHDIKTPLTSIINYVDLLKQEEMTSDKAKEYLEILDNKSQRLKKLTEDLVEASKVSSGNIKLNIEILDVKELIQQMGGEFEDKFKQKELEIISTIPKEEIKIKADSRYLYRVIENIYSNIAKYAMEHSRVYVDVIVNNEKVLLSVKNISKEELNISVTELMQRFVRGDVSRNTEGSGLGLSIARSLTELQGGKFDIYLDGDLFKVIIEFEIAKQP